MLTIWGSAADSKRGNAGFIQIAPDRVMSGGCRLVGDFLVEETIDFLPPPLLKRSIGFAGEARHDMRVGICDDISVGASRTAVAGT